MLITELQYNSRKSEASLFLGPLYRELDILDKSIKVQTITTRSHAFFKSKIKTRCKIFLFLFLIFRLSLSSSHFQRIKFIKLLFTKYKSKVIRVTMVTIHIQLPVSIVLWIIITVTLTCILFKMSSVIIYRHSQLKRLGGIDFSCVFNVRLRSLIHNASAIFRFRLLLWKLLSITLKSMVLTFLCDFCMLWFHTCNVWSLPLCSFVLSVIRRALSPT